MAVNVKGNTITMTRGDTLRLQVNIEVAGEVYAPAEGDTVRFALKRSRLNSLETEYADKQPLIRKVIPSATMILQLDPEDTKALGFGRYDYDIEITFSDGVVDTFISDTLTLAKEVD